MHTPLVTVAIPAYNHAPFIAQAIESVLSQDVPSLEVLVIDDASTDATADIAEAIAARDPRVRVIRHPRNLGPGGASEEYVKYGRGEYLATLPSDDMFAPGKLKAQLEYLSTHPEIDMVGTGVMFIDEAGEPITHQSHFAASLFSTRNRTHGGWLRYFFEQGNNIPGPSLLFRMRCFRELALDPRLMQLQDYDYWVRWVLAGYRIGMLDAPLTWYRILNRQANLSAPTAASRARNLFEHQQVLERYHGMKTLSALQAMLPDTPNLPPLVTEEAFVQHRLAQHAWAVGTPQHRMFALNNWYRLLGRTEWREGLASLGVDTKFLAQKAAEYPLARALAWTPYGIVRRLAEWMLPGSWRNRLVRFLKTKRDR